MGTVHIGVSGWSYKSWEASFYPSDLPKKRQLEYLTRRFNTVEVNGSFYRLQRPTTFAAWRETAPRGFVFAVKGGRFITHNKKLNNAETPVANFFASGLLALGDRLGPVLWQLPASLRFDAERLTSFLGMLPKTTGEMAEVARGHDERVKEPLTEADGNRRVRHALEVRHPSFYSAEAVAIAREAGVALVFSDAPGWPLLEEITAGFVYARLHGSTHIYASRYTDEELDWWADRIRLWSGGGEASDAARITPCSPPPRKSRDVYVYFDNDQQAHAPHDALRLMERLPGLAWS